MSRNTKTFDFDYYNSEDSIPNEPSAEEKEIAIGLLLSRPQSRSNNPPKSPH